MECKIKRALISVSDKTGVVDFARELQSLCIEIISTGGTADALKKAGIEVTAIDQVTGFLEMLDGRVKTLHPKIHGGILAIRSNTSHQKQVAEAGISYIDIVAVNLYPFAATIAKKGVSIEEAIENIDIGGPAMVRSAAKNHYDVAVVVEPADYTTIISEIKESGEVKLETRKLLAVKAFRHTSQYDATIESYLHEVYKNEKVLHMRFGHGQTLRYGENSHQNAAFYIDEKIEESSIALAKQLHGKELSYNNIVDADASLEAVKELWEQPGICIVKHTNPCGYATGKTLADAFEAAWQGDPVSAFGGIVASTRTFDLKTAELLKGRFVEIVLAPDFEKDALEYLKTKSSDIRLLKIPAYDKQGSLQRYCYKHVTGGMLVQDRDLELITKWEVATKAEFREDMKDLAVFAWKACKHTKSNAIILAREYAPKSFQVIGMGAGQPNRVDAVRKLCIAKAMENLQTLFVQEKIKEPFEKFANVQFSRMVLASDAFFPFADNIDAAHSAAIRYIIQPGGSKKDADVIAACDRYGIAMALTGTRHFRH